mgnify:CR=1 FL=1
MRPRRRVEQRDVHGVRTVASTLVEEEHAVRPRSGWGAPAPTLNAPGVGERDRVRVEMLQAIVPVRGVAVPHRVERVEDGHLDVGVDAVHQRDRVRP